MLTAPPPWLDVSRETLDRLHAYVDAVLHWTPAINLISKASISDIWHRHVWDSAQVYDSARADLGIWLDIGSGGGFPGIVMAIMGASKVMLVESDQRKAAFLREVSRQLSLPVTVIAKRLQDVPPVGAATMTARALAALTDLMPHAYSHLRPDGCAIFPKGRNLDQELGQAQQAWRFDVTRTPSKTDPSAAIVRISHIQKR